MNEAKLESMAKRLLELEALLSTPEVISDQGKYTAYAKEFAQISEPVSLFVKFKKINREISQLKLELGKDHDNEFKELAKSEIEELERCAKDLESNIDMKFESVDPQGDLDCIVEIRAGTGGQEASLFAADLLRMYSRYAQINSWVIEELSSHPTESKGYKEVVLSIRGKGAYGKLKFESGVHRVQRVPQTEASGRIHTSAATVAVLPEAKETDLVIDPKELRVDIFRSSGPGGQSVNTADSAVRITHLPTGLVVQCQDERSQLKNKIKAMRVLRTRILERQSELSHNEMSSQRRQQIKTGDRSEKIRTYNFSEHRVTDHRIGLTVHRLEAVLEGDLGQFHEALLKQEKDLKSREGS